jgi:hypothetical protein
MTNIEIGQKFASTIDTQMQDPPIQPPKKEEENDSQKESPSAPSPEEPVLIVKIPVR